MLCDCVETSFPRFLWKNRILLLHPNKKYYSQSADQEDLISIGTIGLIKGISTFDASKGARLATYAARCVENEILMYFRSMKKTAGDVSLSDCIETGKDGNALSLMDVLCSDEDLFEELVEEIVAESQTRIRFRLHGGIELAEKVGRAKR